jgi:hypothetical protein
MPNTTTWQEFARLYFDQYYLDLLKEGKQIEEPYIYTVAKGKSKTNNPTNLSVNLFHRNPCAGSAPPRPRGRGMVLATAL